MFQAAGLSKRFWSDAVQTVAFAFPGPSQGKTNGEAHGAPTFAEEDVGVWMQRPSSGSQASETEAGCEGREGVREGGWLPVWIPIVNESSGSIATALTAVFCGSEMPKDRVVTTDADMPIIVQVATVAPSDPCAQVAKAFMQQYGVDDTKTASPVARHESIRDGLVLAVQLGWWDLQLDVETAFLNSELTQHIYVTPSTEGSNAAKVWKLKKGRYELKEASHAGYDKVTRYLLGIGLANVNLAHATW
ncbi:unnamed protein product [Phytophthora fragariaefolia]|uniref:Unnamed protein product n=1 Tax=Phytophthora fragariaefolia TaxID=1490495 RepID=A0A9W6WWS9_9STRA|nr:unnamed protein product [Phytophthora fragariaefolia]